MEHTLEREDLNSAVTTPHTTEQLGVKKAGSKLYHKVTHIPQRKLRQIIQLKGIIVVV
jgi:hypothetical protein